LVAESGDEDAEGSVGERAERAGMRMTALTVLSVEASALVVVLNAGSSPVVDGISEAWIAGSSHKDLGAFSAATSNGSDSGQRAQRVVVSQGERLRSLREHRGADESSHARKREKDLDVAMLPTFTFGRDFGRAFLSELSEDFLGSSSAVAELLADELDSGQKKLNMLGGGLETSGGELEGRLKECEAKLLGRDTTNSVVLQDFGKLILFESTSLVRSRSLEQQIPQPGLVRGGREL
jgi:hypothetical protein